MTDHTANDHRTFEPDPERDAPPVTAEQLASEPALPALGALALTRGAHDALARRIEAAAAAQLAQRALARRVLGQQASGPQASGPQARGPLGLERTSTPGRRRSGARDLAPVFARALRPALLAAAAAGVFAVGLAREGAATGDVAGQQVSDATAVQALSLHDPSAQWADQARAPSADALGRAIGLGGAP